MLRSTENTSYVFHKMSKQELLVSCFETNRLYKHIHSSCKSINIWLTRHSPSWTTLDVSDKQWQQLVIFHWEKEGTLTLLLCAKNSAEFRVSSVLISPGSLRGRYAYPHWTDTETWVSELEPGPQTNMNLGQDSNQTIWWQHAPLLSYSTRPEEW